MSCNHEEHVVGPVTYRIMRFRVAGDGVERHQHAFDHATLGVHGQVRVRLYDDIGHCTLDQVLESGMGVNVPAEAWHELTALAGDSEAWCVFVTRGTDRDAT